MTRVLKITSLILTITTLGWQSSIFGQSGFEVLRSEDIESFVEVPLSAPSVVMSGGWNFYYQRQHKNILGKIEDNFVTQNFYIDFESAVFAETTFVLRLATQPGLTGSDPDSFYYYYSREERQADEVREKNSLQVVADRLYLEYRHNPLVKLTFGRQLVELGDKKGMIYRGNNTALTQSCTIGTWCYYIGRAITGKNERDNLSFWHIDYPIYDQEETVADIWEQSVSKNRLNVGLYTIYYHQESSPLANYGGATRAPNYNSAPAAYSDYQVKDASGDYVFRDIKWDYFGVNVDWQAYPFTVTAKYIILAGNSAYYSQKTTNHDDFSYINKVNNDGNALSLEADWRINPRHKLNVMFFRTSGNKAGDDPNSSSALHARNDTETAFYEVNKGTYGEANIYFGGFDGVGEAHSVSNLTFFHVGYSYFDAIRYDLNIYSFGRTDKVYNQAGLLVNAIGLEIDNDLTFFMSQNLSLKLSLSTFIPDKAYSKNDNLKPAAEKADQFTNYQAKFSYFF